MANHTVPETVLQKMIDGSKTPSVQYRIFNKSDIIYSYSNGLGEIQSNRAVDDKTTYHAFSVTKTVTALATLQLAAEGKIGIDDPVYVHLPDFPYGQQITVRNLLSHSSGIPNPIPLSWIHLVDDHPTFNKNEFLNQVVKKNGKTKLSVNEKFAYSNINYMFLGKLIEKISNKTYEEYVGEHILDELEPQELYSHIPDPQTHATGYHKRWSLGNSILGIFINKSQYMGHPEKGWKPFNHFYVNNSAYGGLIGTPSGFVAYIRELLKEDSKLIPNHYKKLLFTENVLTNGKQSGMCLSWFTGEIDGNRYYTHAGGGGGYYVELRIYPVREIGSVIMFNRSGMKDERLLDEVDKYFIGSSHIH